MANSLVSIIDASTGRTWYSNVFSFTEPRSMIVLNAPAGSTYKRVGPSDLDIKINLGVSHLDMKSAPGFTRKGFWMVDMNSVYPNPLPPWVVGVSTRVDWNVVEPSPGAYDFSSWIAILQSMQAQGKKGCLSIRTGDTAPAWLFSAPHNVASYTATQSAGGTVRSAMHWTGTYEQRWQMLMQAAYDAANVNGLLDTVGYVKVTMATNTTAELRWPSEYGGYVAGTELGMKNAGWRPTLAKDSIIRMCQSTAAIWGMVPVNTPCGIDCAMSSEYFMTPHIDDAGNIGAVQHIFPPILDAMIAIAGPGASGHSDAIGLGGVTDGIDSLLLPYINTATIGGQMAEKEFGWPQCTPGVKPNCPWSPHPSGRPTAACQATIYDQSCRFAQGQGGKFMEIFGGTSTCYPAETLQMAVDFGWPTS